MDKVKIYLTRSELIQASLAYAQARLAKSETEKLDIDGETTDLDIGSFVADFENAYVSIPMLLSSN